MICHPERSICYREAKANVQSKDPLLVGTATSPARNLRAGPPYTRCTPPIFFNASTILSDQATI